MLADPQSVTINAVPHSLPRTGSNPGQFTKDDGAIRLTVSHANGKRIRSSIRLDNAKISADPMVPSQNQKVSASVYLVIDRPQTGYTNAELKLIVDGFLAWMSASSGANVTKVLGGES